MPKTWRLPTPAAIVVLLLIWAMVIGVFLTVH
jgi:hypothetical protein